MKPVLQSSQNQTMTHQKGELRAKLLMNIDAKTLNKILAN
jgi:hypothetical protein